MISCTEMKLWNKIDNTYTTLWALIRLNFLTWQLAPVDFNGRFNFFSLTLSTSAMFSSFPPTQQAKKAKSNVWPVGATMVSAKKMMFSAKRECCNRVFIYFTTNVTTISSSERFKYRFGTTSESSTSDPSARVMWFSRICSCFSCKEVRFCSGRNSFRNFTAVMPRSDLSCSGKLVASLT